MGCPMTQNIIQKITLPRKALSKRVSSQRVAETRGA